MVKNWGSIRFYKLIKVFISFLFHFIKIRKL